ncbi:MAG TPA: dihydroxy-acid dehydratase, partial [Sulfitobacter sp.]|nr:dihydroxy-acid dehydratase [Sulfitobacter sp.]
APIHLNAIAGHLGIALSNTDWEEFGHAVPLLVNMQPVGTYLGEDFHRAGGTAAVIGELLRAGLLPHPDALTVTGQTIAELYTDTPILDEDVIRRAASPLKPNAGFLNMRGNLFDSALMKTSAIDAGFRARYFSNAQEAFEGRVALFDGPEDFHARIDDPALGLT